MIKAGLFKRNIACLRQRYQLSYRVGERKGCQDLATGMPRLPLDGTPGVSCGSPTTPGALQSAGALQSNVGSWVTINGLPHLRHVAIAPNRVDRDRHSTRRDVPGTIRPGLTAGLELQQPPKAASLDEELILRLLGRTPRLRTPTTIAHQTVMRVIAGRARKFSAAPDFSCLV